jgi:glycogen debranching enzyme
MTRAVKRPHAQSIVNLPLVSFGRETCGDLAAALRREWLVTNGLGGYASGTLAGINSRRYHGLLVAALAPPVERTVLVGGLVEWATYAGTTYPLSAHEYGDGTIDPHGYRHIQSIALEGMLPVWTFALADALLERRIWMAHGANTTYITYRLLTGDGPVELEITPLLTYRDFHSLSSGSGWQPEVKPAPGGIAVQAFAGARPFRLLAEGGAFEPGGQWWWNFYHRVEAARGLDAHSDLYGPGSFRATLAPPSAEGAGPDSAPALIATAEASDPLPAAQALESARERQRALLARAAAVQPDPADRVLQQLTLAADQFLVERVAVPGGTSAAAPARLDVSGATEPRRLKTVIAGYHWFNDWGRDTMISLPGLTLATGRPEDAADILRAFAGLLDRGMLPNNFPDRAGVVPGYNTVDATLWYVLAIRAYEAATGDVALVDELLPGLREIADWHVRGTRYGIGVDPADGLLRAGEPGVQLTWMDAKVGDYVVTPRIGKPVEINALWYNALRTLAAWLAERTESAAPEYEALAERAGTSFRARFRSPERPYLADVVDGPSGDDWTLRPNQVFALALPYPLVEPHEAAPVLTAVERSLLTTYGLRTLPPVDRAYRGYYGGDQLERDTCYHQGPVWPWLLGAYLDAVVRVHGERGCALALQRLRPVVDHLRDAGLGSVSEILTGDPPHRPEGCIAQAWSVAEMLRIWCRLQAAVRSDSATEGEPSR